ncbi:uncharacterized protein MEPE_04398 [Melanopsichium pennsylvanicum]|uniref:Alpha/beta hydrolase fold-3 domain-containing protein n=2 Tax=Melanopsichium pennsylvanicum TaxID=63383 RepID=A0AAJ4XMQ0_9BASI|nr:alpha beta-hydrolase [Melanopsichium pennsylvanicum 4]SNX85689.1 uncharacterized protein MEPE_04398 [Melanopsichium pennsylvanicum]
MKTASGHYSFLEEPSWSPYHPTPFPKLEHHLFPPRDRQTLVYTLSSTFISILRLLYVLFLVVPIHTTAALLSHALIPKSRWLSKGWGRGVFPSRLPNWGIGQPVFIPIVGSLLWALVYGTPKGMGWQEERTVPWASRWLFGRAGHEGWTIGAESVTLPPLPIEPSCNENADAAATSSANNGHAVRHGAKSNGGIRQRQTNGHSKHDDRKSFIDRASEATTLSDEAAATIAPQAAPYDADSNFIPADILRGSIRGQDVGVHPQPIPAFFQWKQSPSSIAYGKTLSVKPGHDLAGIGSGAALSPHERIVLFFVGGGYHSGHAPQGPLSWTVCRQTSLRVLGVNFRKATKDSLAFPAALQDAVGAWVYVIKRLGFKPENVILMGDSAGGGLCLTLQLYLSSLMWSSRNGNDGHLGRARKLVLHSPMTDLTLGTQSFTYNEGVDIISPYKCSLARDNYLRHFIPVDGRKNLKLEGKILGEKNLEQIAGRYKIDPYTLSPEIEASEKYRQELSRLAKELTETIHDLGAFHPLFSMGLNAKQNIYLAQTLLLFRPIPSDPGADMEFLITAGTGEIFYDQIKFFTRNLLDLNFASPGEKPVLGQETGKAEADKIKVSLVEGVDWHHVFAYMNLPGVVKGEVDDVAKTFMLA